MFIIRFIFDNYIMLFELIGLWIMLRISAHITVRLKRLTRAAVVLLFLVSLCFRIETWTHSFETLSLLRPMMTAAVYSIYPAVMILVMQITQEKPMPLKKLLPLLVPWIICIPLYFTSQWTHLVCWFDENNRFVGGALRYMPYAIIAFYTLMFLVYNYGYFRRYSRTDRRILSYIVIGPVAGVLLTILLNEEDKFCAMFTSAIVLYYLFIYIHMARTDPLTSLLNRQSYYQDIEHNASRVLGVASVDMNELKYINDNLGHEAGDQALKTIADALRDHCGQGATVYRVGGDEFMVFYSYSDEARIRASISAMRQKLSETPYTCAFGYEVKSPDKTLEDMIRESDRRMYEDKAALKKAVLEQGGELHART